MRQDLDPSVPGSYPASHWRQRRADRPQGESGGPRPPAPASGPCSVREVLDRFGQDRSDLTPAHIARLRAIARCVRDSQRSPRPIRDITLIGHASAEGSDAYNLALGKRRAEQTLARLRAELEALQTGLSTRVTLRADSRGERELTGRGREFDRRVEIQLPRSNRLPRIPRRPGPIPPPRPRPRPPTRGCAPQRERIRLHLKILFTPSVAIDAMVRAMQQVFHPAGFRVEVASRENLTAPSLLDLDLRCPGSSDACPCDSGAMSSEQTSLFSHRNNVGVRDVAVYFVRSTTPSLNGCASHPPGRPAVVVTSVASQWTLGHEVGHVLGLRHVGNNDRLMTGGGTHNITNPPPDLIASEIQTMTASTLTVPC
jgi:outer membrane protein OmpA-like peptidoglycan-associated protein